MYLYLLSLRVFFFSAMLINLELFEKRCGKPTYFPEEGTICHFLDESVLDQN